MKKCNLESIAVSRNIFRVNDHSDIILLDTNFKDVISTKKVVLFEMEKNNKGLVLLENCVVEDTISS